MTENAEEKEGWESAFEVLQTINKIMSAPFPEAMINQIAPLFAPMFQNLLQKEAPEDFVEEGLELLNLMLYKCK